MTRTRTFSLVAITLLVLISGCAGYRAPVDREAEPANRIGAPSAPADLADPRSDRLGWEKGYWYNEPITIDTSNGLNASERQSVIRRTMARIEYIRGLEFKRTVPVTVISRQEFRSSQGNRTVPTSLRRFDNAKFEALFMINESADSIAVQNTNSGSYIGGYYSIRSNRIVLISDASGTLMLSEITLAHELTHAVQDQHFGLGQYNQSTREEANAIDGLIEGDTGYVEHLYQKRCGDEWTCVKETSTKGGGGGLANIGPYLIKYQPYSDGPAFVRHYYRKGGWHAINDMYDRPPASTEQTIHPERYPEDDPVSPKVADRTQGSWERLSVEGRVDYGELGEAGTNAILIYPTYDSNGQFAIIPPSHFLNYNQQGNVQSFDPFNYDHRYTDGIRGDRLVVYTNANEQTGYVWKLVWDNSSQAKEFLEGYQQLLNYHDANVVSNASGPGTVYRIPEGNGFADAFRVVQRGDAVVITNAPTVQQLSKVRQPTD